MPDSIQTRKIEHLELTASGDVEARQRAGWDDIRLLHTSLPEVDLDEVDCSQRFLGRRLRYPIAIAGMTGGFERAGQINAILAHAAESFGLAVGVGSQRAALVSEELAGTFAIARREAPSAFVIANVGAPQLIDQESGPRLSLSQVRQAVQMVAADALAVHLNYLQEVVQPEGDHRARGCVQALAQLCAELPIPVIAKETGGGMTRETAMTLRDCGVKALDVGGRGGTSFAAVEGLRAASRGEALQVDLGKLFREWGIPTAVSITQAVATDLPLIATGGVRSGLDAAKAIALGATLVGVGRPLVQAALEGQAAVETWLHRFVAEFRAAMFLTGSRTVEELRRKRVIVTGETLAWVNGLSASIAP